MRWYNPIDQTWINFQNSLQQLCLTLYGQRYVHVIGNSLYVYNGLQFWFSTKSADMS